jgi:hypothetical protein
MFVLSSVKLIVALKRAVVKRCHRSLLQYVEERDLCHQILQQLHLVIVVFESPHVLHQYTLVVDDSRTLKPATRITLYATPLRLDVLCVHRGVTWQHQVRRVVDLFENVALFFTIGSCSKRFPVASIHRTANDACLHTRSKWL